MHGGERKEFEVILAELFGALDKPLTEAKREGFWKGLSKMSLVDFAKCRDTLLENLSDGESRKNFSVSDVWAAKKLRAVSYLHEHPIQDNWPGDKWDMASNLHLMAYLLRRMQTKTTFSGGCSYLEMRNPDKLKDKILDATPDFVATVNILVGYKKSWAADMREADAEGNLPKDAGENWWQDCIRRAEALVGQKAAA